MGDRRSSEPARVDGLRTGLQRFIEGRAESAVSVVALSPLPGGTMRHAWAVDLDVVSGPLAGSHRLIYLQDRGGGPPPRGAPPPPGVQLFFVVARGGGPAPPPPP